MYLGMHSYMYMCVYIYVCVTMTKEAMNLKENMEV